MSARKRNEQNIHTTDDWLKWIDALAEKDFVVIDDFMNVHMFDELLSFIDRHKSDFERAGIGTANENQIDEEIRGDLTYWFDPSTNTDNLGVWKLIDETMNMLNRYCFLSLSGKEFHLAHYPKGTWYKKHLDQFSDRNNRLISMVCYLNTDWIESDGGELKIFLPNDTPQHISPLARRCVLFKSGTILHGVQEVNKSRYSLTGWFTFMPNALNGTLIPANMKRLCSSEGTC